MNWKKLTIGLSVVNILGWILIEIWSYRYAESNIAGGAGVLIFVHTVGYYIVAIGSLLPKEVNHEKIYPHNCPGHDWQKGKYSDRQEQCVICNAERGI